MDKDGNEVNVDMLRRILEIFKTAPKLTPIEARQLLTDLYDYNTGIQRHNKEVPRPLGTVAMHDSENFIEYSTMYDVMLDFGVSGYSDIWGISFKEFLSLPHWQAKLLRKVTTEVNKTKKASLDDIAKNV